MDSRTRRILKAQAPLVFESALRSFQPEFVLLWVVDENGNEIEHEFIPMQDALAMVDPRFRVPLEQTTDKETS